MLLLKKWDVPKSLTLKPSRTKAIFFKPLEKGINQTRCLYLGGNQVAFAQEVKTLGMLFSDDLSCHYHIHTHIQAKLKQGKWFNEQTHALLTNTNETMSL